MDDSGSFLFPQPSQTSRDWVKECLRAPPKDLVAWESAASKKLDELRKNKTVPSLESLDANKVPSYLEQFELDAIMRPAASALQPYLSSSVGSSANGSSVNAYRRRKPARAPQFTPRPIFPPGEDTRFSALSREVAQKMEQNQKAKQRAEVKRLSKQDKGKQRATEPLSDKSTAPPRPRAEELTDRTNVSTDGEDSWEADLGEASLMDIDTGAQPERRPERAAECPKPIPKKPPVARSSHVNATFTHPAPAPAKHSASRPTPSTEVRRSVSAPQDTTSRTRPPAPRPSTATHPSRPTAQPAHARDPPPPKAAPTRAAPPPPPTPTPSRKPPALGMRRTNTHPGVGATFRPSQELPTKQRGFKPPLARAPEQPSASFPVAQRAPSPPLPRGRAPVPVVVDDPDSSYGDISMDLEALQKFDQIMSQYG